MTFLRQFSSFVVVGCIATGVHYALLIGLVEIAGISAVAAALVGYGAGGTVSYGLNRRHTFRTKLPHEAAVSRFTLVGAVGFGLTYIFMSLFVRAAGSPYLPAQVATTGIVMFWSFAAHRLWTFPADRDGKRIGDRRRETLKATGQGAVATTKSPRHCRRFSIRKSSRDRRSG
jgi:putative flippase GtrA